MLLELVGIEKRFGGVTALRSGSLTVRPGEIHLLMGENGAGKSTLMKIVAGMQTADGGQFLWQGQPVCFRRPAEAAAMGIAMVHQESLLAPHLTVGENIFLGREGGFFISRRRAIADASKLIEEHRFPLRAADRVSSLSPAGRQLVEICRAISQGSSLLIFDEPTSSLSDSESREVFRIVRGLKDRGMGVIYITHRLEELREVGDHVTVLRDGETVHSAPLRDLSTTELIRHMVGRAVNDSSSEVRAAGDVVLETKGITTSLLQNISLKLRGGEITGLAGMMGAGRTELCRALFGVDPLKAGSISIDGKVARVHSPRDAVRHGIVLIPEDRQRTGLARELSVGHNISAAALDRLSPWGFVRRRDEQALHQSLIEQLRIKTNGPSQRALRLSGGNQQKVVIAKWLARGARVFLFDEPTRGIDVGAKAEVFTVMDNLARSGAAILMVSSELPELLQHADRILVMRGGAIAGELSRGCTQEDILRLAVISPSEPKS
jgi:ABC-type sugar transport system ATPase subunit